MELFAIKDAEEELYFQLEKTKEVLASIDKIAYKLFKDEGYIFENSWQSGLPEKEDYMGFEKNGIYMAVIISKERVHIIIKGLTSSNKADIKKLVMGEYEFKE